MKRAAHEQAALAALEATLRLYLRPERPAQDLPTLRLLTRPLADITATAQAVLPALQAALAPRYQVQPVALQARSAPARCPWSAWRPAAWRSPLLTPRGVRMAAQLAGALRVPAAARHRPGAGRPPAAGHALPGRRPYS